MTDATNTTPTMIARFAVQSATLVISARKGVRGFNVRASFRPEPKQKSQSGAHKVLKEESAARAEFNRLKADAVAKGWVEKPIAGSFTEIPAPPGVSGKTPSTRTAGGKA